MDCPVAGNTTAANFKVTMQPGDNFAIAASLDGAYRDGVRVNTAAGTNLTDSAGQIIPISGQTNPNNVRGIRTNMLTVWRRLHIEVDSMGEVQGNFASGTIGVGVTIAPGETKEVLLNAPFPGFEDNRFENGLLAVGQKSLTVIANTSSSVTVRNDGVLTVSLSSTEAFRLYDDDDFDNNNGTFLIGDTGDNIPMPDTSLLTENSDNPNLNVFAPAYIRVLYDIGGGNSDFATNVESDDEQAIRDLFTFDNLTTEASLDFWTAYLLSGYQYVSDLDEDPESEPFDGVVGVTDNDVTGQGSIVFYETNGSNECTVATPQFFCDIANSFAHEVSHLFGTVDGEGGLMSSESNSFSPTSLSRIRKKTNP